MKSLTRTLLPIAILAGVVFGITFMTNYTDGTRTEPKSDVPSLAGQPPLRFFTLTADPVSPAPYMKFWESNVEVGSRGQFDFWCLNRHEQPVTVAIPEKNCQCTSAEIGIVDPAAYIRYQTSLVAGSFLGTGSLIWNALNAEVLRKATVWHPLNVERDLGTATVPAAKGDIPQPAIVRLSWVGKTGESPQRTIRAKMMAQLPKSDGQVTVLEAHITILPSFSAVVPGSAETEVRFGDLTPGGSKSQEVVIWSATRPALDVSIALSGIVAKDPHFEWTPLEPLTAPEQERMERDFVATKKPIRVRSAYKTTLTVRESTEVVDEGGKSMKHLEIGPFERRLAFSQGGESVTIPLRGAVRGAIRLNSGTQDIDRIDFGLPYPSNQARTKEVTILAERPGTDLEIVPELTSPAFLQVQLVGQELRDGRPVWSLKATIPAGKLFGALSHTSAIVLQAKDDSGMKIRIPVVAQAHGGGASPF